MSDTQTTEALHVLLDLFEGELSEVPFPDVNAETLRAANEAVEVAAAEVERLAAALDDARAGLEQTQQAFERIGRKALAYARVYAEDDPDLGRRLAELSSMLAPKAASSSALADAPRKRGRPRKSEADLFSADARPAEAQIAEAASA